MLKWFYFTKLTSWQFARFGSKECIFFRICILLFSLSMYEFGKLVTNSRTDRYLLFGYRLLGGTCLRVRRIRKVIVLVFVYV